MIFDKHRFEVWTQAQHPYKHNLGDFAYSNPALPGVTSVDNALNWVFKVLYPDTKGSVANVAALPSTGNTLNDYRVVLDDGDGKQAGYRWEQREGDVSPKWYKIFDFDWSTDAILAAFMDITISTYFVSRGKQDRDSAGNVITGLYAGQRVYGGTQANQNLTLEANSGDGVGAQTGYVQVGSILRPTTTNTLDLGMVGYLFRNGYFGGVITAGTLTIGSGSIIDSSNAITFGSNVLTTTGNINGAILTGSTSLKTGTITITGGAIADTSGALSFNALNLTTTGSITGGTASKLADITFANGSITSTSATISFGSNALTTSGNLNAGTITGTQVNSGNVRLSGNTVSITNTNGSLVLQANGSGFVDVQSAMTTIGQTVTGILSVTGQFNIDNLRLDGNVISSTDLNGNITFTPNGTGVLESSAIIRPTVTSVYDLGQAALRFKDLYLSGGISDGTTSIAQSVLQSFRGANTSVSSGMSLFWNGSQWLPSLPDTEITHSTLTGLTTGDAGHTQFVMLAGRAGGQVIQGGTASTEHLVLESTSNAAKGKVKTKDSFTSFAAPAYSAGWTGTDLGAPTLEFRNIYTKGELVGARLENYTSSTLPSASAQNVGRVVWSTDNNKIYVDTGGTWLIAGSGKYISDTVWNGVIKTLTVTVSASITDARNAIWALHDNTNNFEQIFCTITKTSATSVTITVGTALAAGSYRLIGIE